MRPPAHNYKDEEEIVELKRFGKDLVEKIEIELTYAALAAHFTFIYKQKVTCSRKKRLKLKSWTMVTYNLAGLENAKQTVQEVVCWPMKRPDLFTGLRHAPNGLLLYGQPGTDKTLIAKIDCPRIASDALFDFEFVLNQQVDWRRRKARAHIVRGGGLQGSSCRLLLTKSTRFSRNNERMKTSRVVISRRSSWCS